MKELDSESVVAGVLEHVNDPESRNFSVGLSWHTAIGLHDWLKVFEIDDMKEALVNSEYAPCERFSRTLRTRFAVAIHGKSPDEIIDIDLTFKEINTLGFIFIERDAGWDTFLTINSAFVSAGGEDNSLLRELFEARREEMLRDGRAKN